MRWNDREDFEELYAEKLRRDAELEAEASFANPDDWALVEEGDFDQPAPVESLDETEPDEEPQVNMARWVAARSWAESTGWAA